MKLSELKQDTKNANKGSDRGNAMLRESLTGYGAGRSILIDREGHIIAGNKTALSAGAAGFDEEIIVVPTDGTKLVAVQRTDLSIDDPRARELAIADNRVAEVNLNWDLEVLGEFRETLDLEAFWEEGELDRLLQAERPEPPAPKLDQAAELQRKWATQRGQLWLIGEHRLLCGDSTNQEEIGALWANVLKLPALMVTDPPYGVDYDPNWRLEAGINKPWQTLANGKVYNDRQSDWREAWKLSPSDVAYVWHAGLFASSVQESLEAAGFEIRSQIIWSKPMFVIGRGHYHWQHEPCWYSVKKGKSATWTGGRKQSTVWSIANMHRTQGQVHDGKTVHGTQKPIECMRRPIANHQGDVYDPFVGSGATIIAAEQLKRRCYAVDLDPGYIAVTLQRLSDLGLEPRLSNEP